MSEVLDLMIIGAGPAGLAAASRAGKLGLHALVVEEQPSAGGQIYREVERSPMRDALGEDYAHGLRLAEAAKASGIPFRFGASIVHGAKLADETFELTLLDASGIHFVRTRHVLIATGAQERAWPFPGWTLPGVMSAGAAQILLKTGGIVAERAVFAGSGPLLFLVAKQYAAIGVRPLALLETTPAINFLSALNVLPRALSHPAMLAKGLGLMRAGRRAAQRHEGRVERIEAFGGNRLEGVRFEKSGRTETIACDHLFVHQGVVPAAPLARLFGCKESWSDRRLAFEPGCSAEGQSSVPGIWLAGDGAGIAGAMAAEISGDIAVFGVALALGREMPSEQAEQLGLLHRGLKRERAVRPLIDALFRPGAALHDIEDETVVCRCENVRAGQIRALAHEGIGDPNGVKSRLRCGMGPCQGRMCQESVVQVLADATDRPIAKIGPYRPRPPLKPLPFSALADAAQGSCDP